MENVHELVKMKNFNTRCRIDMNMRINGRTRCNEAKNGDLCEINMLCYFFPLQLMANILLHEQLLFTI